MEHFCAAMDNVSDLLLVVMGFEAALMAVMRLDVLPVKVEHFGAAIDSISDILTVVMGLETALMAVMRLDVLPV